MKFRFFTISILLGMFLMFANQTVGQTGTVRGNIFDKDNGEPIISATVQIKGGDIGETIGTTTDIDGFFALANIPVGDYRLVVTYIGYDSLSVNINIKDGSIIYKRLDLVGGITLQEVSVSGEREEARTEVKISAVRISTRQIKALPSTGGEPDIAQYLAVLPGVIFSGDQGGQLYIRGGSPIQNKILLDGLTIYKPFHSIGFFSVFETEAIRSVDVLTGGFNAEHGGRISAIVDIKTREGNKKRLSGIASVSPFMGKVLLEGPIKKLKEDSGNSTSFLLTAKHSYLDQSSKAFYEYAVRDSSGSLPFSFTDVYGKMSFVFGGGSKLNLFGFNFRDQVEYKGLAKLNWKTTGGGANFKLVPPSSNLIIDGIIGGSRYDITLDEEVDKPRKSSITSYTVGFNFTYFGKSNEVRYGFNFTGLNTNFQFTNLFDQRFKQESFVSEAAAYMTYKHVFGKLIIEPSLRFQYYIAEPSDLEIEPRFGLKYNITDDIRFKMAGGLYSQNLLTSVNERDIVNLFVGFLTGPDEEFYKPNSTEKVDHRLQKAIHAISGVEVDLSKKIQVNLEGYFKDFTQLININRNKLDALDPDYVTETGKAYGVDFSIKYHTSKLYLYGAYSLGYVKRDDGEQIYPTIFDRRHNVNLVATYNFGEKNEWEASTRWNMGSGFPFTQTQGFYGYELFPNGVSSDILTNNPNLGIIYSNDRNGGRLPYFHRLDISLKRTFEFSKHSKLEAILSVTNAYNRKNIFFVDRVTTKRVDQLPILPSFGLVFNF
ncbi:MAG TPA: TonB-dependent receptor [Phaeodactylibacter sp.]|nr:TonB-dependent receptor [Phaeodactylibacter sp.]